MNKSADVIVVGMGGCGASALYHLARRGLNVIGIDRFEPGHDRGSSHGETRVIRQAYFEHPDYVPLLRRAYSLWEELEDETGDSLMDLCGLLMLGPPDGEIVQGSRLAAQQHNISIEDIDATSMRGRFPAFVLPKGLEALWEPTGGYLRVEECVRAYARLARSHGATLHTGESVLRFKSTATGVTVETDRATYSADRLVLNAGAWTPTLVPDVARQANLHVLRKVLGWYPRRGDVAPVPDSTFFVELPHGAYYGFPCLDGSSVKLAEHTGGTRVEDPLKLDRSLAAEDTHGPERFIHEILPSLSPKPSRHGVCMYTMTDDAQFIIDRHPEFENVVLAAGFSGHGFKFMSAMGAIMTELAVDGETESEIGFLGLDRFTRRD